MTTRLSSVHLASEGSFDTISTDSLSEMRSLVAEYAEDPNGAVLDDWEPREGTIITEVRAISARINQNFDAWPSDELREAHHTFVGKPVFVNHNNHDPDRARGRVVASRYVDAGENDRYVQVLQEVEATRFPMLAKELMEGGLDSVSMGAEAREVECSYCANISTSPFDACEHIAMKGSTLQRRTASGQPEDVLIYEVCRKISFFELSYVFDPADETAVASNVLVANRQGLNAVEVPPKVDTLHPDEDEKSSDDWHDYVDDPNVIDTIDVLDEPDLGLNQELERPEDEVPEGFEEFENIDEEIEQNEQAEEDLAQESRQQSQDKVDEQAEAEAEEKAEQARQNFDLAPPELDENGDPIVELDENGDPVEVEVELDENGDPIVELDENGDTIELDENGDPIEVKDKDPDNDKDWDEEDDGTGGTTHRFKGGSVEVMVADDYGTFNMWVEKNGQLLASDSYANFREAKAAAVEVVKQNMKEPKMRKTTASRRKQANFEEVDAGAEGFNGSRVWVYWPMFASGRGLVLDEDAEGYTFMWMIEDASGRFVKTEFADSLQEAKQAVDDYYHNLSSRKSSPRQNGKQMKPSLAARRQKIADHNGWTNFETWQVVGILDNDQTAYQELSQGVSGVDHLRDIGEFYAQGEGIDLGQVNWQEIYDSYKEDGTITSRRRSATYAPGDKVEHTDDGVKGTVVVTDPSSGEVTVDWEDGESSTEPDSRLRAASRRKRAKYTPVEPLRVDTYEEGGLFHYDIWDADEMGIASGQANSAEERDQKIEQSLSASGSSTTDVEGWYPITQANRKRRAYKEIAFWDGYTGSQDDTNSGGSTIAVMSPSGEVIDTVYGNDPQAVMEEAREVIYEHQGKTARRNGARRTSRTNDRDISRKESHMAPQRRRRIADDNNKQTPLLEETGIAQTPAPEPVALPEEGDSVANNSESDRVKSARKALAREVAIDKARQRRAKAEGADLSGASVKREDLFQDYPATTMTAKLRKRFATWVQANYGVSIRQASGPGELRSWARAFAKESGIELPRLHSAIKRDVMALRTAADDDEGVSGSEAKDDDIPEFIQEKIDGDDDDDDDEKKEARRKAALRRRRRAAQAQSARGSRTKTTRRRTADEKLDLAAPGDRVDVEKPTSGTTDEDAEASQFDKADFDNNSGKGLENVDNTPASGTPGGPSVNDLGRNSARASGLQAVQLAEAMIAANLIENSREAKFKAAAQFEKMSRDIVLDRTALLEKVVTANAKRPSTKSAGNRGASLNSAVPPNLSGATRSAAPQRREAATDSDSDIFF